MSKNSNEYVTKIGNIFLEKVNSLNDPIQIGKCIRTIIRSSAIVGSIYVVCKNGGINYKNKILIGSLKDTINSKKELKYE